MQRWIVLLCALIVALRAAPMPSHAQLGPSSDDGWILLTDTANNSIPTLVRPDGTQTYAIPYDGPYLTFARVEDGGQTIIGETNEGLVSIDIRTGAFALLPTPIGINPSDGPKGRIVYLSSRTEQRYGDNMLLTIYDPQNDIPYDALDVINAKGVDRGPDWSPVGDQIAFIRDVDDLGHVFLYHLDEETLRDLSNELDMPLGDAGQPRWSHDGEQIVFWHSPPVSLSSDLYIIDLPNAELIRLTKEAGLFRPVWSPDGSTLIATTRSGTPPSVFVDVASGAITPSGLPGSVWDWYSGDIAIE